MVYFYKAVKCILSLNVLILLANTLGVNAQICTQSANSIKNTEEDDFNQFVINFKQNGGHLNTDLKIIPIVVHIIYNNPQDSALMNFNRIQKAINRANIYLRRLNADTVNTHPSFKPLATDVQIQLCLAQKKPNGSFFNGIIYTPNFTNSQLLDVNRYLNIIIDPQNTGASATFPWETSDFEGINIGYSFFGYLDPDLTESSAEGKIFVHELGHYLGLYHTFHNSASYIGNCNYIANDTIGDRCTDTPLDWSFFPIPGEFCDNAIRYCDSGDSIRAQVENYMHYNRDECLNMFSNDQRARMRACLNSSRATLVSSDNYVSTGIMCSDLILSINSLTNNEVNYYPNPFYETITLKLDPDQILNEIKIYDEKGNIVFHHDMPISNIDLRHLNSGSYIMNLNINNQILTQKIIKL